MRRPKIHRLPIQGLLLSCLLASAASQAEPGTLVVTLNNVRDTTGNLRASLYRDPDSFRKEDKALQVVSIPAIRGDARLEFKDVPPGRYAIMAYHDADADGRLDLRLGMFPTEGYGLSNNPQVFGPPKFADSAFEVGGTETSVNISMSY
jgi:uncharacterized protein (DUF2141 family)